MKWSIVTDSSCEYRGQSTDTLIFEKIPFLIRLGENEYRDDEALSVETFLGEMESCKEPCRSACPPPAAWKEAFLKADHIIAIAISSGVSGSYAAASAARDEVLALHPEKKILLIDSKSAGSALSMLAMRAESLIAAGTLFHDLCETLTEYAQRLHTLFALSSFDNLVKNGRMNKLVGLLAGKLGFFGIGGASEEGTIITKGKARGENKLLEALLSDMDENGFRGGKVLITHCFNERLAKTLREAIAAKWQEASVDLLATGGLCSFYAERGGLIMAYEGCKR